MEYSTPNIRTALHVLAVKYPFHIQYLSQFEQVSENFSSSSLQSFHISYYLVWVDILFHRL